MITKGTNLIVGDNSGGKMAYCVDIKGSSKQSYTGMGNLILVTAKKIKPGKKVARKKLYPGLVVTATRNKKRKKGYYIKFGENRVVLFSPQNKFLGTRIYGPICKEIRTHRKMGKKKEGLYKQILSYAKKVA